MSILIKGMKMPKKCKQCWFFGSDSARVGYCYLLKGELPLPDGIPQDCPLIEVPKHGRLIDVDVAYNRFLNLMDIQGAINPCQLGTILVDAPTIIESEE